MSAAGKAPFTPWPLRRTQVLLAIQDLTARHGEPPTVSAVADVVGVSLASMSAYIGRLVQEGRVAALPKHARRPTLALANTEAPEALRARIAALEADLERERRRTAAWMRTAERLGLQLRALRRRVQEAGAA